MPQYQSLFPGALDTFSAHGSRDGIGLDIDFQETDELSSNQLDLITDAILELERAVGIGGQGIHEIWDIDLDTGIQTEEAADEDILRFDTAGTERMVIDTSGKVFINDTINTEALGPSLTIQGGGQDGEYVALKSSDVTHTFTGATEADTYYTLAKNSNAVGGARLSGFLATGQDQGSLLLIGRQKDNADTTTTAAGHAAIRLSARISDGGAGDAVVNAGGNLVGIENRTLTTALFNEDGDLYLDAIVNINAWDEYNDAELVRAGRLMMRSDSNPIKKQFMGIVDKYKDDLVKWKLINPNEDDPNHFMMATKKWIMLNADCNWQNYERNQETRAIVDDHDKKMAIYERAFEKISQVLGIPKQELLTLGN